MSIHKKRIDTIRLLLLGSCVSADSEYNHIIGELNDVGRVKRISEDKRRRLLEVLHSTRMLDSTLVAVIRQKKISNKGVKPTHSLGGYLLLLEKHSRPGNGLASGASSHYQKCIVGLRNQYMHKAGSFPPTDKMIRTLLSDMQSCLAEVLTL